MPVQVHDYDELKLRLERREGGSYRVFASASGGEASGSFELPFGELELENFVLRLSHSQRGRRRMESPQMNEAKRFGGQLFDAVFQDRVRDLYHVALSDSERQGRGLRLTLYLTHVPELMHIPWEYLYDDPSFLAISAWTPVVRYLDLPRPRRPLEVEAPLRVLGMVSSPTDAVALDVQAEKAKLEHSLGKLTDAGAIELHWLEDASLSALLRELRNETFHIFHYIGHGIYDSQAEDGVLLLEDANQRGRPVSGSELGTILHDSTSLRLAVLNACEGARTARDDPFAGVAASLVQREIPAVIAMQFEITDEAAVVFAEGFYEAMAAGFPVDAALAEARKAIFADHNDTEWGTPVLFMRVADGRIFDISAPPAPRPAGRLEVSLSADREDCEAGEAVNWCAIARNAGGAPISEVTVLDGQGQTVGGPFDLPGNSDHTVTWTSRPETDVDQTVTVGGRNGGGKLVSAQATTRVAVRQPPPPPPAPQPVAPPRDPETVQLPPSRQPTVESGRHVVRPSRRRRRRPLGILGDLIGAGAAVALIASLSSRWDGSQSGWDAAKHPGLIVLLALVVIALAAARLSGLEPARLSLAAPAIAIAGLVMEDRLVLQGVKGDASGRLVAVAAAAGIVVGGAVALAADARGDPRSQRVSGGELIALGGAAAVFVSVWLSWSGKLVEVKDLSSSLTGRALAVLAATVVVLVLARALIPALGLRPAGGAVLLLLGLILAERVGRVRDFANAPNAVVELDWLTPGRLTAAGGAALIILGGLAAMSAGARATRETQPYA